MSTKKGKVRKAIRDTFLQTGARRFWLEQFEAIALGDEAFHILFELVEWEMLEVDIRFFCGLDHEVVEKTLRSKEEFDAFVDSAENLYCGECGAGTPLSRDEEAYFMFNFVITKDWVQELRGEKKLVA